MKSISTRTLYRYLDPRNLLLEVYAALLTALYDRQVSMYQTILELGAARGDFTLTADSLTIARNLVALQDAYGYRIVARHPRSARPRPPS